MNDLQYLRLLVCPFGRGWWDDSGVEAGRIIRDRRLHQSTGLDVFAVARFPSGYAHPVVEIAGFLQGLDRCGTQPALAENAFEFAQRYAARVRIVADPFNA